MKNSEWTEKFEVGRDRIDSALRERNRLIVSRSMDIQKLFRTGIEKSEKAVSDERGWETISESS